MLTDESQVEKQTRQQLETVPGLVLGCWLEMGLKLGLEKVLALPAIVLATNRALAVNRDMAQLGY